MGSNTASAFHESAGKVLQARADTPLEKGKHQIRNPLQALAESLDKALRADDPYFNKLIRILATRCMTQALYFGSGDCSPAEYLHYGLAAPLYTHFTSPIRR